VEGAEVSMFGGDRAAKTAGSVSTFRGVAFAGRNATFVGVGWAPCDSGRRRNAASPPIPAYPRLSSGTEVVPGASCRVCSGIFRPEP
jgi:hypothetical protein